MNEFIWLGILILSFITEISTAALVAVWFMPGALIALILSALDVEIWIQVLVFLLTSAIILAFSRTIFKKYIRKGPIEKTNSDALVGETGIVLEEIDNIEGRGQVKVKNQTWRAVSSENTVIMQGALVEVLGIDGVKLICKIIEKEN